MGFLIGSADVGATWGNVVGTLSNQTDLSNALAAKAAGAASSTDNAVARFDSTTGKIIQNSVVLIGDTGIITGASLSADQIADGSISNAEFQYLNNVSSNIQTQLDGKEPIASLSVEVQAASGAHTINLSGKRAFELDLQPATGDVTLTLSNPLAGTTYLIKVIQSSTARNLIWPAAVKWALGIPPVISTGNDEIDVITLFYDGSNYLGTYSQAFA